MNAVFLRNPWPYAIMAFFACAITGIVSFVLFANQHRMELVRPDYYEHEVRYQEQIDRVNRTKAIRQQVLVNYDFQKANLTITLPQAQVQVGLAGNIQLYRPSDSKLDQEIKLTPDAEGIQRVDTSKLKAGLWKVRVSWEVAGQEYYFDQSVVVAPHDS